MPVNLASPGIRVREVDLTSGRIDPTSEKIGGLVAPFAQGPVDLPVIIGSEKDLLDNFGKPYGNDKHYEHWLTASSFLAYGGQMRLVRVDGDNLKNAIDGGSEIKIKNVEHYEQLQYDENIVPGRVAISKNPGSWANGVRIGIIDSKADQILTLSSVSGLTVGLGVTQTTSVQIPDPSGTTKTLDGYFKGIIAGVNSTSNTVEVKFVSHVSAAGTETPTDYEYNGNYRFVASSTTIIGAGAGTTSTDVSRGALGSTADSHSSGTSVDSFFLEETLVLDQPGGINLGASDTAIGISTADITTTANDFLVIGTELISLSGATIGQGQITGISRGQLGTIAASHSDGSSVKYLTRNAALTTVSTTFNASATNVELAGGDSTEINSGGFLYIDTEFLLVSGLNEGDNSIVTPTAVTDWFDAQDLSIAKESVGGTIQTKTVKWNTIAERPGTSKYATEKGARFDELHVVVIDGEGKITGNAGTILERHLSLSKASDAEFSTGNPSYWRTYLKNNSAYIFGGSAPSELTASGFTSGFVATTDFGWDQDAEDGSSGPIIFGGSGNKNLVLSGGKNYDGASLIENTGALVPDVSALVSGYTLLENKEKYEVDFLIMGSANYTKLSAQALAQKVIASADKRKDAIAFISPYRGAFLTDTVVGTVTVNSEEEITENVLSFYAPLASSSYAIFDSGYKYMYDRFANTFRYIPLNGDIAGLCARNDIDNFPWFSPAGTTRGSILNAVKLAYNPTQEQRDRLYSARINPVIVSPGGGIVLFGDKTGLAKASAFDRINVRRLFIYLEDSISAAARDQLFEFNDEITRSNFVNIVEPFLRDVQAKRGITDYVVICDETNNTAAVIDNNEFVADIYIKPARSINFIGLTFVATRTGVAFEEVIGNV